MGRHKSPDGRRVPVSFKLTEAERDLVDSLRGETERSVWLREKAISAAKQMRDSRIPEPVTLSAPARLVSSPAQAGTGALSAEPVISRLAPEEPAPEPTTRKRTGKLPCEHRVKPGSYCARCRRLV